MSFQSMRKSFRIINRKLSQVIRPFRYTWKRYPNRIAFVDAGD